MALLQNNYLKWSVAGLLLGVGFVAPIIWPVSFLGGLYFVFLLATVKVTNHKIFGSWLAWTIKSACATSIFWSAYPIEWVTVELGHSQFFLIFMYWATVSIWLGEGAVLLVFLYKLIEKYSANFYYQIFLLPLAWVISEVCGSFIFSVMMYGAGGTLNTAYSLGYVGYLLAENDLLLQIARLGGVYALSFLFTVMVLLVFRFVKSIRQISFTILLFLILYITSFFSFVQPPVEDLDNSYHIVAIDTHPERSTDTKVDLEYPINQALVSGADYILLPEDSRFFNQNQPDNILKANFNLKYENSNSVILDSGPQFVDGEKFLQAIIYDGQTDSVTKLHKRYLVPQGEFMPYLYTRLVALGGSGLVDYISQNISYRVGPNTNQSQVDNNIPGVLFCFESVDPMGVRRLVGERNNMPFVAHPISHTWFHESEILWHQLDTMLKIQAVWNKVYIVSAANHADAKIYTPSGYVQILNEVERGDGWVLREIKIPIN